MKIENLTEFQDLFKKLNFVKIFGENPEYYLIHSNVENWLVKLNESLSHCDLNQLCVIGLVVNHEKEIIYINTLILVLRPSELNNDYLTLLNDFINSTISPDGNNIITFLRNHWKTKPHDYPLTFLWTTNQDNTHISDNTVAPAYQNKGLMKVLSLALVEKLQKLYTEHHHISAITIHPATYLFFAPWDKDLKHYYPEELQESTCRQILKYHAPAPQPISTSSAVSQPISTSSTVPQPINTLSTFVLNKEIKSTLLQYGLLYRPIQYNHQARLESDEQRLTYCSSK